MFIFEIFGIPTPQKQTQWTKRGFGYDPSKKDKERIQWQIKPLAPDSPILCPVEMHLTFFVPIPQSTSGIRKRQMLNEVILPTKKPDVDNLAYLVTNALKTIVYQDDSQITDLVLRKRYSDRPRTVIKIIPIEEIQPVGGIRCG